ncbi:hypothetical protein GJ700_17775 [Duganella sp. FT92W]|uniref:MarR family transcriptional regulator n=1 Tax=Pseudoduganella rivuli TaxID=2666085 RepID=A0A7X2IPF2_9BURK|nr:hypothetical protein [Pseudoduganella rivuli]MRV73565.1 hypothetical protein [Pseudoduganella rivuli]
MSTNNVVFEFLRVLFDKEWHELYEMHTRFRLNAVEIHDALTVLHKLEIIERRDMEVRISANLTEQHFSIINKLSKTTRPVKLAEVPPELLTRRKKRV